MLKKLLLLILLLAVIAVGYYAFTVFRDRESDLLNTDATSQERSPQPNNAPSTAKPPSISENTNTQQSDPIEEPKEISDISQEAAYTITSRDCANECTNIEDEDKKTYCKEVCGLTGTPQDDSDRSCDALSGLQKDYCIRDSAVKDSDLSRCTEIRDSGVRTQCQNRIQEDIIDEIM